MIRLLFAAALSLHPVPQDDADQAAAELLRKYEAKIMKAKTVQVDFDAKMGEDEGTVKGELRLGERGAFHFKVVLQQGKGPAAEAVLRSDGKGVVARGPREGVDGSQWRPESVDRFLRRSASQVSFMGIFLALAPGSDPDKAFSDFDPQDVKSLGKEKVGDVEASVVSFTIAFTALESKRMTVRLWMDPDHLTVLKRTLEADGRTLEETVTRFELDGEIPASVFEFQSAALLAEGRAIQLARSVALHARFTGRLPKTLEDLKRRPADLAPSVFWPEGGFWIGGEIPKDAAYSSDEVHFTVGTVKEAVPEFSPIGAPSDRLKKFFEARIRVQLIKAAAEGYYKATSVLPKSGAELLEKPEGVAHWPEGGWLAALPVDPWGSPYAIRGGATFSVFVEKSKGKAVKLRELTAEERRGLEEAALPELSDREAQEVMERFKGLGAESLADREAATRAIISKGGGVLRLVSARLESEKDPEIVSRLGLIRDHFKAMRMAWNGEMKPLRAAISGAGGGPGGPLTANERMASTSLKTLATAQADFRANDRDGNRTMDFWVRDLAGLHSLEWVPGGGEAAPAKAPGKELKLIEPTLAQADATESRWDYPTLGIKEPQPKAGYLFAALKNYPNGGMIEPYHKGDGRNADCFGFVAYPSDYGATGRKTFIINEDNTIWWQDLEGEEVDTFPSAPASEGWLKVD